MTAKKFTVTGRVQGVGFRYFVLRQARELNINGWVRNRADASVEIWAEGSSLDIETLETLLHQGPPGALVRGVRTENHMPAGYHRGFEVVF